MLKYMTYYRGIAILFILIVHSITRFWNYENTLGGEIFYSIFAHSTNIFIFISGFLYEHLLYKNYTYKKFIGKKVNRLIVPYIFWSLPGILLYIYLNDFSWRYLVYTIKTGLEHYNDAHWYISLIIIVFLLHPLWKYLAKQKILLYAIILPLTLLFGFFSNRAEVDFFYSEKTFLFLIGFFILGMFCSAYKTRILKICDKYKYLISLFFVSAIYIQIRYNINAPISLEDGLKNIINGTPKINLFVVNKFLCVLVLLWFCKLLDKKYDNIPLLEKLAQYSFGIYFVHLYVCYLMYSVFNFINIEIKGGFLNFIILTIVMTGLVIFIISLTQRIRYIKNIVGV